MAKNKNRKQAGPQDRSSQATQAPHAAHAQEQAQAQVSAAEAQPSPAAHAHGSPAAVARKQQKRFGHN